METPKFALGDPVEFRAKPNEPLQTGTVARVGGATIGVYPKGSASNSITILAKDAILLPQEGATPFDESDVNIETANALLAEATNTLTPLLPEERVGEVGAQPESATEAPEPKILKALNLEFDTTVVHFGQLLDNPFNPRRRFRGIPKLALSILRDGLEHVFKGRRAADGIGVEVSDGGRRKRAIRWLIDNKHIEPELHVEIILEEITDEQMLEKALTANLQKDDLNPLEVAEAFKVLESRGMSQGEIGKRYNYSQPAISNFIRLLSLPEEILQNMEPPTDEDVEAAELAGQDIDLKPKVSPGHGGVLLQLKNKEDQLTFLERILMADVSVAQLAREVREFNAEREKLLNPPLAFEPSSEPQVTGFSFVDPQTEDTLRTEFQAMGEDQHRILTLIFAQEQASVPALAAVLNMSEGAVRDILTDLVDRGILEETLATNDDSAETHATEETPSLPEGRSGGVGEVAASVTQAASSPPPTTSPAPTTPPPSVPGAKSEAERKREATAPPATKTPAPTTTNAAPKPRGAEGITGKTPEPAQAKAIPPVMFSAVVPGEEKAWVDAKGLKMAPMLTTVRRLYTMIEANESLGRLFNAGGIGEVLDFFDTAYPPTPKA